MKEDRNQREQERKLREFLRAASEEGREGCPDLLTMASFSDGSLGLADKQRVEDHLTRCETCRLLVGLSSKSEGDPLPEVSCEEADRIWRFVRTNLRQESSGAVQEDAAVLPLPADRKRGSLRRCSRVLWKYSVAAGLAFIVLIPCLAAIKVWLDRTSSTSHEKHSPISVEAISPSGLPADSENLSFSTESPVQKGTSMTPLPEGFVDSEVSWLVTKAEVEAWLPQTDDAWETWARDEYPHVMWLYDMLGARGVEVGWKDLLFASGEAFRYDWPVDSEDPNCQPRKSALLAALEALGIDYGLLEDGCEKGEEGISWPHLAWIEEQMPTDASDGITIDGVEDGNPTSTGTESLIRVFETNLETLNSEWSSARSYQDDLLSGKGRCPTESLAYLSITTGLIGNEYPDAFVRSEYAAFNREVRVKVYEFVALRESGKATSCRNAPEEDLFRDLATLYENCLATLRKGPPGE